MENNYNNPVKLEIPTMKTSLLRKIKDNPNNLKCQNKKIHNHKSQEQRILKDDQIYPENIQQLLFKKRKTFSSKYI